MTRNRMRVSDSDRLDVGSSRISRRGSWTRDLAISTICCCAIVRSRTIVSGSRPDAEPVKNRPGLCQHFGAIDEDAGGARLHSEKDVLRDRHVWGEVEFLEDDGDALVVGVANAGQMQFLTLEDQLAAILVRWMSARDDLHEGRLAGAVLAHDGMHRAGLDLEGNVL